ncbi:hypothetical protein [Bradyrhizobium sp.]|uniref:hypothetical protein n=1 Tax=Bradyrhizobium sp. TaxID=376 RepID=UPI002734DEF7|nr:hypothetical protein [Bradyrhizobium sp.]MDP3077373.1 hypothetical protein [Bradyrhizobium sp.]
MYTLVGAYFLTEADQDVGFPAFKADRSNMLFTVAVDKELSIIQFFPVIIDRFHFRRCEDHFGSYSLGDVFPFLFFWLDEQLVSVDVGSEAEVNAAFKEFEAKPFADLQLARFFANRDRPRAVRAISEAAKVLEIDKASRLSFISTETSLVSLVDGIWQAAKPEVSPAVTADEIFREFESIGKRRAHELLRDAGFKDSDRWPYLFIIYESKFGYDEFIYILGKEFIRKLTIYERAPSPISGRLVSLILDKYLKSEFDRELEETVEELMETNVFDVLCTWDPHLFMKAFDSTHRFAPNLEIAQEIVDFLLENEDDDFAVPFKQELFARLYKSFKDLSDSDLIDFGWSLLDPDDDGARDQFRLLMSDRSRLSLSIQARLRHLTGYRAVKAV